MKLKCKVIIVLVAVMLMALVLTGCGGRDNGNSPTDTIQSVQSPQSPHLPSASEATDNAAPPREQVALDSEATDNTAPPREQSAADSEITDNTAPPREQAAVDSEATDNIAPPREQAAANTEAEIFTPLTFTLVENPYQDNRDIPASAISIEEAAQIGARYIRDVFGTSIDGLYMKLTFTSHQFNNWWAGNVFAESPDTPTLIIYLFTIDSITGERINITYLCNRASATPDDRDSRHRGDTFTALEEAGWFNKAPYEQLVFAGISDQTLDEYMQIATRLAQIQFYISGLSEIEFAGLGASSITGDVVDIASLTFIAIDNTGREVLINIPSTDAVSRSVNISTLTH